MKMAREWEATARVQVRNNKVYFRRREKKGWLEEMVDQWKVLETEYGTRARKKEKMTLWRWANVTIDKAYSGRGADNSKRKVLKEHDSLKDCGQLFMETGTLNKNITLI